MYQLKALNGPYDVRFPTASLPGGIIRPMPFFAYNQVNPTNAVYPSPLPGGSLSPQSPSPIIQQGSLGPYQGNLLVPSQSNPVSPPSVPMDPSYGIPFDPSTQQPYPAAGTHVSIITPTPDGTDASSLPPSNFPPGSSVTPDGTVVDAQGNIIAKLKTAYGQQSPMIKWGLIGLAAFAAYKIFLK